MVLKVQDYESGVYTKMLLFPSTVLAGVEVNVFPKRNKHKDGTGLQYSGGQQVE